MSEIIQVYAIVSESGQQLSVTVGDITYRAEHGFSSFYKAEAALAADAEAVNKHIVVDGVSIEPDPAVAIHGCTVTGVNAAQIGSVETTSEYGVMRINDSGTVLNGMTFSGNIGKPAVSRIGSGVIASINNCLFAGNYSPRSVGVIRSYGKNVSFNGSTFSGNTTSAILITEGIPSAFKKYDKVIPRIIPLIKIIKYVFFICVEY